MTHTVRTRFAPSPTGAPHVGNIRTAIFAWLFARHNHGTFVLRIEDTDAERAQAGSIEAILEALDWLGIDIDEGVKGIKGAEGWGIREEGTQGPYIQSNRLSIYQEHAHKLLESGAAYYCFCTSERLSVLRALQAKNNEPPRYDQHCASYSRKKAQEKLAQKKPYVIRLRVPESGATQFTDAIKGVISVENRTIDHQVLLKSDGYPTYHLASVVDDHLMDITHVLRADEWIASTPKHVLLYRAFGWEAPAFVHLPIILGPDKSKLSKRHGAVSVLAYQRDYVPEALFNYLALLGWNPKDDREILSKDELIQLFTLDKINKNSPIFDVAKLDWMNAHYIKTYGNVQLLAHSIKQNLAREGTEVSIPDESLHRAVMLAQNRTKKLSHFVDSTAFVWQKKMKYDGEILIPKKSTKAITKKALEDARRLLEKVGESKWSEDALKKLLFEHIEKNKRDKSEMLWPLRVAVTGKEHSPDVFGVLAIIGKAESMARIAEAQKKLS